jgi:hypothetical protein
MWINHMLPLLICYGHPQVQNANGPMMYWDPQVWNAECSMMKRIKKIFWIKYADVPLFSVTH